MQLATELRRSPPSRFVEDVRTLTPPPGVPFDGVMLPDGRTSLVCRVLEGGRAGDVWIAGPKMSARDKHVSGFSRIVTVRLHPGRAARLLGVTARELRDCIVPLGDVWGRAAEELCEALVATTNAAAVSALVDRALAVRSGPSLESASGQLARRAVALLEGAEVRVERVADRLGVTTRHLRRAFTEHVGVGPKEFARTVRLQRAVRLTATSCDWARIAADAGYYDQAHLVAEFRQLVGRTPGAFVKAFRQPAGVVPGAFVERGRDARF